MADNNPNQEPNKENGIIRKLVGEWIYNRITKVSNRLLGEKIGVIHEITKVGTEQTSPLLQQFQFLFGKNDTKINTLIKIESQWEQIETVLFGNKFHYEQNPNSNVFADRYRIIEYFRDYELTLKEAKIFKEFGTIKLGDIEVKIDKERVLRIALKTKKDLEEKNKTKELDEEENDILKKTDKFLENAEKDIRTISLLPKIDPEGAILPFIDGRPQKVVVIGPNNMIEIRGKFEALKDSIDHFASSNKMGADIRTPVNQVLALLVSNLEEIEKIESKYGEKLEKNIAPILKQLESEAGAGLAEKFRPDLIFIRFAHTYKIIKSFVIEETRDGKGIKTETVVYFKDRYPEFKREDEVDAGLDENGWPLEVFEHKGQWYVLTDRWWEEISENKWQMRVITGKKGGKEVWKNKVGRGVKVKGKYGVKYRSGYIRKVPDKRFVGDLDSLDKISFISNETDAFRDDFRDGRFHLHSKSSMDYIIAGMFGINTVKPINLPINTQDLKTRIKFRPIYYTKEDFGYNWKDERNDEIDTKHKKKIGTIYDKEIKGLGINPSEVIPEDEQKISRKYDMDREDKTLEDETRKPTHLNPAFDRAAIEHEFIHWGRMLYYETPDGINRWSENPFPHVTTRGIAKFIIDFVLRNTFSFENARKTLKREPGWDYGIRHYGGPFTKDPLAPGGVLEHAKAQLAKRGNN